ncbi:MAG: tetratricopeptide repeat protein, partial [Helicobacteraceae bacterium]|nr:tetratricopeptide repeat protein [Helicobacteraceae bacterium]
FQEAIKQYTQAIDLDPSYANAYVSRGVAYEGLGEAQNAETDANKARELDGARGDKFKNDNPPAAQPQAFAR